MTPHKSKEPGVKLRARTHTEQHADGWWCVLTLATWKASEPEDAAIEAPPFRVGPFPSRQVARRELEGDFRKACVDVIQRLAREHGGTFEWFIVGVEG